MKILNSFHGYLQIHVHGSWFPPRYTAILRYISRILVSLRWRRYTVNYLFACLSQTQGYIAYAINIQFNLSLKSMTCRVA